MPIRIPKHCRLPTYSPFLSLFDVLSRLKGMVDPISISCTFHGGKKAIGSQVQKVGASLTLVVQISSFILRRENLRGCRLRGWGVSGSFKKRRPEKCPIKIQVWVFLEVSGYVYWERKWWRFYGFLMFLVGILNQPSSLWSVAWHRY